MSMMGEFLQITPTLLAQLRADPDLVPELLEPPAPARAMPKSLSPAVQNRLPQALAAVMRRYDPSVQEQLAKRLGISADALRHGETGPDLLQRVFNMGRGGQESQTLEGRGAALSIDKAWHGVHYLLCGQTEPGSSILSQAVLGGTEIGEDLGYGRARYFDPRCVAEISGELAAANLEAEMTRRYDPALMSQLRIYPFGWDASGLNWLLEESRKLTAFYSSAASQNLTVLAWLA